MVNAIVPSLCDRIRMAKGAFRKFTWQIAQKKCTLSASENGMFAYPA